MLDVKLFHMKSFLPMPYEAALAPRLKEVLGKGKLFLAGAAPKDLEQTYRDAGIDDFISVKANCYEIIRSLQREKGMKITEEEVK